MVGDGRYSINTREGGRLKTIEIANPLLEEGYDEGEGDTHRDCQGQRVGREPRIVVIPSFRRPRPVTAASTSFCVTTKRPALHRNSLSAYIRCSATDPYEPRSLTWELER
jgi:hypothetical protein